VNEMACHQTVQVSGSSRARSVAETLTIEDIRKKLLQLQEEEDEVTRLYFLINTNLIYVDLLYKRLSYRVKRHFI
jgi:hypothetical protein